MSRDKTKPKTYRLTAGEEEAIQELALAGWVKDPEKFKNRTEVGVLRKALRDAWNFCPATKDKPFPGEE
jgi:hypothetical protein